MIAGLWDDFKKLTAVRVMMYTLFNLDPSRSFFAGKHSHLTRQLGLALQGEKIRFLRDRIAT